MAFLNSWQFDSISFWIGVLLAALLGFLLFRTRKRVTDLRDTMGESYRTALEALTALEERTLAVRENVGYVIAWDILRDWIRWVELGIGE